jgi:acetolactate synthase-1/2/3 large subunit
MTQNLSPSLLTPAAGERSVPQAVVGVLEELGVAHAFGVSGGGVAAIWAALSASSIEVSHFRHEAGAAFAATEASLLTARPVAVFVTTGPGVTNALTGLLAARSEGAKVVLISACTSATQRGRGAIQETGPRTMPAGLYAAGPAFDLAEVLETPDALAGIASRLAEAMARGPCTAHLAIPTALFAQTMAPPAPRLARPTPAVPSDAEVARCAALLGEGPFAIWLGYGARGAADAVRKFAEHSGAMVFCTPRGKGIFPETHKQFVGVTGMGGHDSVMVALATAVPARTLVLGTQLGEPSSFWHPALVPPLGFIHVDRDPTMPGRAYPDATTLPVIADIEAFVTALHARIPPRAPLAGLPRPPLPPAPAAHSPIRPDALMAAIQTHIIDSTDAPILAESGNSFTWATHYLRFQTPNRYRVSTQLGAMGHCAAGVVGAAIATRAKTVAIVGDGAMLMNNEINTAAKYNAPAVWLILNDARYNMCEQGMSALGLQADARFPQVDFAAIARAMGASAETVVNEADLPQAIARAMAAPGPYLLDIHIDPDRPAPAQGRNRGLRALTSGPAAPRDISFPGVAS